MKPGYTVRQKAKEDLDAIWLYTVTHWDVEQAEKYNRIMFDKFEWLAENGKAGHYRSDIEPACYCLPCQSHLIIYDIYDDRIEIVRVMHQKADLNHWNHRLIFDQPVNNQMRFHWYEITLLFYVISQMPCFRVLCQPFKLIK